MQGSYVASYVAYSNGYQISGWLSPHLFLSILKCWAGLEIAVRMAQYYVIRSNFSYSFYINRSYTMPSGWRGGEKSAPVC